MTRSLLLGQRTTAELNGWPATTLKKKKRNREMWFLPMTSPGISLPSSHCLFPMAHKSTWDSTAKFISVDPVHCMHGRLDGMPFSLAFASWRVRMKPKLFSTQKWKGERKGKSTILSLIKLSACTCTGYNTINNAGKNVAWRYVPGNYFVPSSCTRHNSGESNLHYSALDLETPSSSINGPDTSSIWGVIWSWWTFAV